MSKVPETQEPNEITPAEAILRYALKRRLRNAYETFDNEAATAILASHAKKGQITQEDVPADYVHLMMVDVLRCAHEVGLQGMARVSAAYTYTAGYGLNKTCAVKFLFWTDEGDKGGAP